MSEAPKPAKAWGWVTLGGWIHPGYAAATRSQLIKDLERDTGWPWSKLYRSGNRVIRIVMTAASPDAAP